MRIVFKKEFVTKLSEQLDYIAQDSTTRANSFKVELLQKLKILTSFPYSCRKSIYFDDNCIRDFTFKGYTIVYRINKNQIEVFGLVKFQEGP